MSGHEVGKFALLVGLPARQSELCVAVVFTRFFLPIWPMILIRPNLFDRSYGG